MWNHTFSTLHASDPESEACAELLEQLRPEIVEQGGLVVEQGEVGSKMYFVKDGMLNVMRDGEVLGTLSCGDYFGEAAMLSSPVPPRSANIRNIMSKCCLPMEGSGFSYFSYQYTSIPGTRAPSTRRQARGLGGFRGGAEMRIPRKPCVFPKLPDFRMAKFRCFEI